MLSGNAHFGSVSRNNSDGCNFFNDGAQLYQYPEQVKYICSEKKKSKAKRVNHRKLEVCKKQRVPTKTRAQ